jgi:seryl-tRNA synthetase
MPGWLLSILMSAGTLIVTLTVTLIYNKLVGLPKVLKQQKEVEKAKEEQLRQENAARDSKIAALEAAINALPGYRAQSLQIQSQLQDADKEILSACTDIKNSVLDNQNILNERLDRLEKREKNALRQKILQEHRIFTDETMNPMKAWTEMEHHSFFELVKDYEELGGNDYVHSEVLPAVNKLRVISMSDRSALYELMNSRKL